MKKYYDAKWDQEPYETCDLWKKSLYRLMKDFCFSKNVAMQIIHETEKEALPGESCSKVYRRGWNKFRSVFLNM